MTILGFTGFPKHKIIPWNSQGFQVFQSAGKSGVSLGKLSGFFWWHHAETKSRKVFRKSYILDVWKTSENVSEFQSFQMSWYYNFQWFTHFFMRTP